ncbi:MAG: hypothetical protein AAFV27_11230 [Pseudomonadota bacterium]
MRDRAGPETEDALKHLEAVLLEYIEKYGLTGAARQYLAASSAERDATSSVPARDGGEDI